MGAEGGQGQAGQAGEVLQLTVAVRPLRCEGAYRLEILGDEKGGGRDDLLLAYDVAFARCASPPSAALSTEPHSVRLLLPDPPGLFNSSTPFLVRIRHGRDSQASLNFRPLLGRPAERRATDLQVAFDELEPVSWLPLYTAVGVFGVGMLLMVAVVVYIIKTHKTENAKNLVPDTQTHREKYNVNPSFSHRRHCPIVITFVLVRVGMMAVVNLTVLSLAYQFIFQAEFEILRQTPAVM